MRTLLILTFTFVPIISLASVCYAQKPELVIQTEHANSITSVAFSSDGKYLVSGGDDGLIIVWEVESGRQIRALSSKGNNNLVTVSTDGKILSSANGVKLWDLMKWKLKIKEMCRRRKASIAESRMRSRG